MSNIIQFPTKPDKEKLEEQMRILQESLGELYESLEKISRGYDNLVNQTKDLEATYQQLLAMYADHIGPENVVAEWLEYCTYVDFTMEDGKLVLNFTPPEEAPDDKK
tara:strand:- start:1242 stop:1562 length:321 start_codon:yes stop_codon:yes gene_type:complete